MLANWALRQAQAWGYHDDLWFPTLSHVVVNKGGMVVSWDCLDRYMLESQICFLKKPQTSNFHLLIYLAALGLSYSRGIFSLHYAWGSLVAARRIFS